ncbi:hypothetical protein P9112_000274 [Eukaryota sp. TZLM1-RC]
MDISNLQQSADTVSRSLESIQQNLETNVDSLCSNTFNHLSILRDLCLEFESSCDNSFESSLSFLDNVNKINSEIGRVSALSDKLVVLNLIADQLSEGVEDVISKYSEHTDLEEGVDHSIESPS